MKQSTPLGELVDQLPEGHDARKEYAALLRSAQLHDATCFTRPELEAAKARIVTLTEPVKAYVSPIRGGDENDGPLESTDLYIVGRGISILCNVPAGQGFTYSMLVDHEPGQSGWVGEDSEEKIRAAEQKVEQLVSEVAILRESVEREIDYHNRQQNEMARLQELLSDQQRSAEIALSPWVRHRSSCPSDDLVHVESAFDVIATPCTCGLKDALRKVGRRT